MYTIFPQHEERPVIIFKNTEWGLSRARVVGMNTQQPVTLCKHQRPPTTSRPQVRKLRGRSVGMYPREDHIINQYPVNQQAQCLWLICYVSNVRKKSIIFFLMGILKFLITKTNQMIWQPLASRVKMPPEIETDLSGHPPPCARITPGLLHSFRFPASLQGLLIC